MEAALGRRPGCGSSATGQPAEPQKLGLKHIAVAEIIAERVENLQTPSLVLPIDRLQSSTSDHNRFDISR